MNIQLDSAERYFVRELAKELSDEIRGHVFQDMDEKPVFWSRKKAAQMLGDVSVDYVDGLIADGEIKVIRTSDNRGSRVLVVPESCEAWKERKLNERRAR